MRRAEAALQAHSPTRYPRPDNTARADQETQYSARGLPHQPQADATIRAVFERFDANRSGSICSDPNKSRNHLTLGPRPTLTLPLPCPYPSS